MDKHKSKLLTSKSNCDLAKVIEKPIGRTEATFRTHATKIRGVYVKRSRPQSPADDIGNTTTQNEHVKAPRRPNRGQKPFLSSVFTLLSKSSTGTQYPDDTNQTMEANNSNKINKEFSMNDKEKKKFRSKILNNYNYGQDCKVLQCKKNIVVTPSLVQSDAVMSEEGFDNIKWADFLPRLVKPVEEIELEKEQKLNQLVKEVTKGRMAHDKNEGQYEKEEPPTLVSERENDPGFYNFFVDLLETTISVYNVNDEYGASEIENRSQGSSKVTFEMDEAVAKKLNVVPESQREPSRECCFRNRLDYEIIDKEKLGHVRQRKPSPGIIKESTVKKKKRFELTKNKNSHLNPQEATQRKPITKKQYKQNLLNLLKQQLAKDNYRFEEPRSLFQALEVMAKNKRKLLKAIRFDSSPKMNYDERYTSKRRKLKSHSVKSKSKDAGGGYMRNTQSMPQNTYSGDVDEKTYTHERTLKMGASKHSLEILNYEYDSQERRMRRQKRFAPRRSFQSNGQIIDPSY